MSARSHSARTTPGARRRESGYDPDSESVNSEENLPGPAQNPSARIVSRALLCMRLLSLALLGTLVLAASAYADTGALPGATVAEEAPEAPVAVPIVEETPESAPAGPVEELVPETAPVFPAPEETPEASSAGPVEELVPETAPVVPAPEETPEAGPAPEPTPVPEPTPEPTPVVPAEETPAATSTGPPAEEGSATTPSGANADEPPKGTSSSSSATPQYMTPPNALAQAATEAPSAPLATPPEAPTVGNPGETWALAAAVPPSAGPPAGTNAAAHLGSVSCQLSVLGGPITRCTTGWLAARVLLAASPATLAGVAVSWSDPSTGAPAGASHDNSVRGSHPATPTPGPAPSGASSGAAVGGSGLAPSAFLTLIGLLLLAAPRAMRRLRLSCEPWLTAFFVLIPERPG
jgi:hypothetical protein